MLKKLLLVAICLGINKASLSMESKKEVQFEKGSLGENFQLYNCNFYNAMSIDTKEDLNCHIENIHKFCRFCKRQFKTVEFLKKHIYKKHKLALDMEEL